MLREYLKGFNIYETSKINYKEDGDILANSIIQMRTVSDFTKIVSEYKGIENRSWQNKVGRYYEELKVLNKRGTKYVGSLESQRGNLTVVEEFILDTNEKYLKRSKEAIDGIKLKDYIEIIRRSMEKNEVALDNPYFNNLKIEDEKMIYLSLDGFSYNCIEMNIVNFIRRAKRKKEDIDYYKLIDDFANYNNLDKTSKDLIISLLKFPYEYMKWVNYYRARRKGMNDEEYILKITEGMRIEDRYNW